MSNNLAIRLTTAGQVFISRNRKVGHPWRWGKIAVTVVVLATAGVGVRGLRVRRTITPARSQAAIPCLTSRSSREW